MDNTSGFWTYALTARDTTHILYGFSYQYYLVRADLGTLTPDGGIPDSLGAVIATINLNTCVPDDVECLLGGNHIARFRVAGSESGLFDSTTGKGYIFSYGKYLKAPIVIPYGDELSLVSKINQFFSNFYLGSTSGTNNYALCVLNPGTARLLIG